MRKHVNRRNGTSTFVHAVVDPAANTIACATAGPHMRLSAAAHARRERAVAEAVEAGPYRMTNREKLFFLSDPIALSQLHVLVWTLPTAHPRWLAAYGSGTPGDRSGVRQAS